MCTVAVHISLPSFGATCNNWTCGSYGVCWRCNFCSHSCSGSSFGEVAGRLLQLGGGPALVLRLLLARATRDLGSEVPLHLQFAQPDMYRCDMMPG